MKKVVVIVSIVTVVAVLGGLTWPVFAQEAAADSQEVQKWSTDLVGRFSASQAGYQNWTEGGVNTFSTAANLSGSATGTTANWEQKHEFRLAYGVVKQNGLDHRKSEDLIRFNASLLYQGGGFFYTFNPSIRLEARSQFWQGFNYKKNPFDDGRAPPVKVSDMFSPATFTQALGLSYEPSAWLTQRLGIAGKETMVIIERLRRLYGVDPDEAIRYELGIESRTDLDKEVFENVSLKSSLSLFLAFNQPDTPDILWENLITMKINEWLDVAFEFVTLIDKDISAEAQVKEILSVGLVLDIL